MNYIKIGKTKKTHGIHGELKLHIEDERLEDFMATQVVFLEIHGKHVPFFIEKFSVKGAPVVRFEDIDSREAAVPLTAKGMFLRDSDIIPDADRKFEVVKETLKYEAYIGYKIVDITHGEVGIIKELVEYPQQEMAEVEFNRKEIMIPMTEALIEKIDEESQMIVMDLPDGMLEL